MGEDGKVRRCQCDSPVRFTSAVLSVCLSCPHCHWFIYPFTFSFPVARSGSLIFTDIHFPGCTFAARMRSCPHPERECNRAAQGSGKGSGAKPADERVSLAVGGLQRWRLRRRLTTARSIIPHRDVGRCLAGWLTWPGSWLLLVGWLAWLGAGRRGRGAAKHHPIENELKAEIILPAALFLTIIYLSRHRCIAFQPAGPGTAACASDLTGWLA